MKRFWAVVMCAAFFVIGVIAPVAAQDSESSDIVLTALHAIPGENDFPADVYINGELAIEGFTKMERTDPFVVDPGELLIEVYPAGADPAATDAALSEVIELAEPGNFAIVAQLAEDGQPVLSLYWNDVTPVAMGQGRFVFRQTSAHDAVDVLVNGDPIATSVATTEEITVTLPAGTFEFSLVPSDGGAALVSADVELIEGELTAVYAISTATEGTLDLAVQTVTGLETAPSAIETGTGGLAADAGLAGGEGAAVVRGLVLAALACAGVVALRRTRERG